MSKNIKHLVVDTTAFIKAADLQNFAENVYTVQEVIDEITNDRQRKKLVVLPYDLNVKEVFTENIKFITEFSKKTGDYISLSATDIKVMALTYQLEKENIGTNHLKSEPTMQKLLKVTGLPSYTTANHENDETTAIADKTQISNIADENSINDILSAETKDKVKLQEDAVNYLDNLHLRENSEIYDIIEKISEDDTLSECSSDSDGGEWITPTNLENKKREEEHGSTEDKSVEVACITSDFAMQNVLKQIGLNVTSVDGRIIKHLRTFIFRCTACFKTTSVMTKLFCPKCGHATLKKVAVSIDQDGNQHIHINGRKPLTARGKRFSLPTPRGGQHFQYPILTEDQHIHKRFATKLARSKTKAMDPDYIAGFSPFAIKDVNSKSAVLGIRADKQDIKYWMKHYSKDRRK